MNKYVSIDLETTGLDHRTCQILEVGMVVEDWVTPIDDLPVFQCYVDHKEIRGDPYGLWMNIDIIMSLARRDTDVLIVPECSVKLGIETFLRYHFDNQKITVAGKNFAGFDARFLEPYNLNVEFNHRIIDPVMLYWDPKIDDSILPNLSKCVGRAGIPGIVTHNAVDDAKLVIQLVRDYYSKL